uniref:Secreted protein n=1 Tax=Picea glauca TaxID=3330 RepID=A0A101LWA1_PICGL|nr:hypothetical protein ABT39_MTgene1611 [Picea glauca]QHR86554.1 hypothetical protein Q903MT_gene556 [Picea sitchensis]
MLLLSSVFLLPLVSSHPVLSRAMVLDFTLCFFFISTRPVLISVYSLHVSDIRCVLIQFVSHPPHLGMYYPPHLSLCLWNQKKCVGTMFRNGKCKKARREGTLFR